MRIINSLFLALAVGLCSQTAFAGEALRKKISDASQSCSGGEVVSDANAHIKIANCEAALVTLDGLYAASRADNFDKNWIEFHSGAVMILLSAAYVIDNDNKLNVNACQNALGADTTWSRIDAAPGSKLDSDIKNDALLNKLVPLCKKAFKTK